jgi:ribosomal protein S18 acetylase RimI-like enzyme
VFAEDVMQLAEDANLPATHAPEGLTFTQWGEADPARFYAVYQASFRDRPGFPGWAQERWIEWISDDEDFRPEWTMLATIDGGDSGFIVGDATGWIAQMGVVPSARGRDIGARLIVEAVQRMRSAGAATITLNVNVDNPHAAALYRRLGFNVAGRRARYEART